MYEDKRMKIRDIPVSGLIILTALIGIPILMFSVFSGAVGNIFKMEYLPPSYRPTVLMLTPWIFSIGWLFMIFLFRKQIATAFDEMHYRTSMVPNRYKIFYGVNAVIVLLVFIFPILTPIICVLSFASIGYKIGLAISPDTEDERPMPAIVLGVLAAIVPIILSIAVLPDILAFSQRIWENWVNYLVDPLFSLSMCISTALTYGSLIITVKKGVAEYERLSGYGFGEEELPMGAIRVFEIILFVFLIFLEWKNIPIKSVFYYGGFFIAIFVAFVNYFKGHSMQTDFKSGIAGYILTVILMGANLLTYNRVFPIVEVNTTIKSISIIISALAYIIIYVVVFFGIEDED